MAPLQAAGSKSWRFTFRCVQIIIGNNRVVLPHGFRSEWDRDTLAMMGDEDLLHFIDDVALAPALVEARPWTVAVIDDDQAVHEGTRFALYDYALNGQGLRVLSAYSAAEGKRLITAEPDIAVVFLDVVMETETAGLDLVDYIR